MVKGRRRWAALLLSAGIVGCNELAGIRGGVFDPCVEDAGDPVCVTSSSGSSSGSASATSSGAGGFRASCGNGALDPDEECDDKNATDGDGCTQCKVDCTEPGAFKNGSTAHCYWMPTETMSFFKGSVICQASPGGQLAAVTSAVERGFLALHLSGPVWIGAHALGNSGKLAWMDGEPWSYVEWADGQPSEGSKDLCVELVAGTLLFGTDDCALGHPVLCERAPVFAP